MTILEPAVVRNFTKRIRIRCRRFTAISRLAEGVLEVQVGLIAPTLTTLS